MTMAFASFADALHMGHHGVYVWSAWAITLVSVVALILQIRRERQVLLRQIVARQQSDIKTTEDDTITH